MILGPKKILQLVKKIKLVENLDKRELTNPEGAGFDLRLGEIYELKGSGFIGIKERKTPDIKLLAQYSSKKRKSYIFRKGKYYLVTTIEEINLSPRLTAFVSSRTTLFRSGIILMCSPVQPGYKGKLTFGLINLGKTKIEIELGARFAHVQFAEVKGGGSAYRGQWQGGRVSAKKKEKQI